MTSTNTLLHSHFLDKVGLVRAMRGIYRSIQSFDVCWILDRDEVAPRWFDCVAHCYTTTTASPKVYSVALYWTSDTCEP